MIEAEVIDINSLSLMQKLKAPASKKHDYTISHFYKEICQQLEEMLNTRILLYRVEEQHPQLASSFLTYGIPDYMHIYYGADHTVQELCEHIQKTIERFDPRFSSVVVALMASETLDRTLRFRIEAKVKLPKEVMSVSFISSFDQNKKVFSVD